MLLKDIDEIFFLFKDEHLTSNIDEVMDVKLFGKGI